MYNLYVCKLSHLTPIPPDPPDSVCTECTSHDSLHPAMLHGVTVMLYTVSGSSEVTSNDVVSFSVELPTILAIDSLLGTALTQYHSGSHVICDFCIEPVKDIVLTVVRTVGQFGKPVKCTGTTEYNVFHTIAI